jgi:hypothetical protein
MNDGKLGALAVSTATPQGGLPDSRPWANLCSAMKRVSG